MLSCGRSPHLHQYSQHVEHDCEEVGSLCAGAPTCEQVHQQGAHYSSRSCSWNHYSCIVNRL